MDAPEVSAGRASAERAGAPCPLGAAECACDCMKKDPGPGGAREAGSRKQQDIIIHHPLLERRQPSGRRAWNPRLLQNLHSPAAGLVGLHPVRRIGGHLQPPSRLLRTGGALSLLLRKSRWRTFSMASVWHRARVRSTTTRPSSASAPCHSTTSIRWPQCKSVPPRSLSLATRPGRPQGCAPLLLGDGHLWPAGGVAN